jgi:hypothetical protein
MRALVGLATGTLLLHDGDAVADKKGKNAHRGKERRRNKRKKNKGAKRCEKNYEFCAAGVGDSPNRGELSQCCSTKTNPSSGNPYEVCTDCGCCPYNSECCISGGDGVCCPSGSKCSKSVDFTYSACCAPEDKVCFGGCCNAEDECCLTTGNVPYCCSGEEGLTCLKTGGNTCQKKT